MLKFLPIASLFMAVLLSGCKQFSEFDELEVADRRAEYAVPLGNAAFSMNDVLDNFEENSVLTVLPDGLLRLQYSGDIITESADDVFAAINETLARTGIIPLSSNRQALPFGGPDGLDIDRMELKSGDLQFAITNCHTVPVTATITFPTVQRNGMPLTVTRNIDAYSGTGDCPNRNNVLSPINLAGYVVSPENDSIYVDYRVVDNQGNELPPSSSTFILINNLAFSYAEGYLGQITHSNGRDTIEIDFFDNWQRGQVYFEEPVITFNFENSFGIPTRSVIDLFNIITVNGDVLPLQSEYITNGIDFPYPTLNEVGQVKSTQFIFNRFNSNIREVLGSNPVAIDYDVDARTNPDQDVNLRGFVTDSSYYRVRVDVDLPLYGSAINFGVTDTLDVSFGDTKNIRDAEFKLVAENSMPVAIGVQGYFLDASGQVLDSLFSGSTRIIEGAFVDASGNVSSPRITETYINFDAVRFPKVVMTDKIVLTAVFDTTTEGQQSVRIKAGQDVQLRLGAIFGVE